MKKVYPVIFTVDDDIILAEAPDMEIITQGTDMADAIEMVRDAIGVKGISMEDAGEELPEASRMENIDIKKGTFYDEGTAYVSLVDVDFSEYRKKIDNRMVRKNVTLPSWLNMAADKEHINVSKVLQEALMAKLGVSR